MFFCGSISAAVSSGAGLRQARIRATKPAIAAVVEVMRMLIFPRSVRIGSLNASPLTKIDIVNPIPPNTVMAASCIQVVLAGLAASLHLIPNQLKKKIPLMFH